jgi:hypothetical protein
LLYINNQYRSGFSSLLILKSEIRPINFGLMFAPFHPFYPTFNKKISEMIEAGLTQYWIDNTIKPRGYQQNQEASKPEVLTLDHIEVCFLVWLVFLGLSCLVFVAEMAYFYIAKKKKQSNSGNVNLCKLNNLKALKFSFRE